METIETRLQRLERQNRIYRNLFILAGLALVAAVSYGATKPVPEVIRARKFEAVNEGGTVVIKLTQRRNNGEIKILNEDRKSGVRLGIANDGSGRIGLFSKEGKELVRLGSTSNGGGIEIGNKTGERVVQLHVDEYGNGVVGAFSRKGRGNTLKPGP